MQHNFFLAFHHQDNLSIENLNREIGEITEKAKFDPTPDLNPSSSEATSSELST